MFFDHPKRARNRPRTEPIVNPELRKYSVRSRLLTCCLPTACGRICKLGLSIAERQNITVLPGCQVVAQLSLATTYDTCLRHMEATSATSLHNDFLGRAATYNRLSNFAR
jgi:hypothetical protein